MHQASFRLMDSSNDYVRRRLLALCVLSNQGDSQHANRLARRTFSDLLTGPSLLRINPCTVKGCGLK